MRYRLQRHDGTDCSATMVPITVLRMVPIQRYRQNKDSNEVKRFIEAMEVISKILDANSLIYRPILDGNRYVTEQELSKALKITKRTLIEYRMNGKLPYYKIGGKILYKKQEIIEILERNKVLAFEWHFLNH